jgi:phosphate transport system substrate-binding protein
MPTRRGKCVNFGLCNRADSREVIQVPEGGEPLCPECEKPLQMDKGGGRGPGPKIPLPLIVIAAVVLGLGGLAWFILSRHHDGDGTTPPGPSAGVILRMHGSNTIGAQLAPAMAEAFLRSKGATDIKRVPVAADEVTVQGVLPGESKPSSIEIQAHGSVTAFADLRDNKCDIGNASRKVKPSEAGSLATLGDMTSPACEHVLGLDGVAVIVNVNNPVRALRKDQIRRVFSGEFSNWSEVGRPDPGAINVYVRDKNSGTRDTFQTLVMGGDLPPKGQGTPVVSSARIFEDSRQLSDGVAGDPNGIGYIGYPYVRSAKALQVSETGARPFLPSPFTIRTEDYPLSRRLYLYTAANPENPLVREYVMFALSQAGQEIVGNNEFVAMIYEPVPQPPAPDAPEEYRRLTASALPLGLDFRFRTGSTDLDNRALYDVDRAMTTLERPQYTGHGILLMGFADSSGSPQKNCDLSADRAEAVAKEFRTRGVQTSVVKGFCSENPVASNDTPEGREKNRRVEIWIKAER